MPPDVRLMRLSSHGMIAASGAEARAFLHAQLTNNIERMAQGEALRAGWCSAKGRLLANFLVVSAADGFLLQLARDLVPAVTRRLTLFVLRTKVRLEDASERWAQYGVAGANAHAFLRALGLQEPQAPLAVSRDAQRVAVKIGTCRYLLCAPAGSAGELEARAGVEIVSANEWALEEIRAGHAWVTAATQEQFVPQMLELHRLGAIDFKKGCYPGQEVVARTQYRGELKRRMAYAELRSMESLLPGQALYSDDLPGQQSGTVVNAARRGDTWELLAVMPVSAITQGVPVRTRPEGAALQIAEPSPSPALER